MSSPVHSAELSGDVFARTRLVAIFALALLLLCVLAAYSETVLAMIRTWERSPTFKHGFIVVPVVLWLVWREREEVSRVSLRPSAAAVGGLILAGFAWFVARRADVLSGTEFMLVAIVELSVIALVGWNIARVLAFPLVYLLFAVPFGEFLVPPLMDWTATFLTHALQASGIPVFREGTNLAIPSGRWSVVEECSGLNYLIASVAAGTLASKLLFRGWRHRAALITLSIVLPLIANGLRAYVIVLIGHLSNNRFGTGLDHLFLGWVLFGGVIFLLFWSIRCWPAERVIATPESRRVTSAADASPRQIVIAAVSAAVLATMWPVLATSWTAEVRDPPKLIDLTASNGWRQTSSVLPLFVPDFYTPAAHMNAVYTNAVGPVGTTIYYFRNQNADHKLLSTGNHLIRSDSRQWLVREKSTATAFIDGSSVNVNVVRFRGASEMMVAWYWYWVDGRFTARESIGKLWEARARLLGRGDDGALIVIYTIDDGGASQRLAAFVSDMSPGMTRTLEAAAQH